MAARPIQPADIYITHIKPGELAVVMAEIARLDMPHRIRQLVAGQVMCAGRGWRRRVALEARLVFRAAVFGRNWHV